MEPKMRLFRFFILSGCILISKARLLEKRNFNGGPEQDFVKSPQYDRDGRHAPGPINLGKLPTLKDNSKVRLSSLTQWKTRARRELDLVRAPMPKFYGMDEDDNSGNRAGRISLRRHIDLEADEDEEMFNLDDSEYEFQTQGKTLEPGDKQTKSKSSVVGKLEVSMQKITTHYPGLMRGTEDYYVNKFNGNSDHYSKVVDNRKFIIFSGSPKFSALLGPWW